MARKKTEETPRPITADDHKKLDKKRHPIVNETLKFPLGEQFDRDLSEILEGDSEEKGEKLIDRPVMIATNDIVDGRVKIVEK